MIQLGLVGFPVQHSLSPKLHGAALQACGLQGDYSLFPIDPDDLQGLADLLTRVRSGPLSGLNVTIPHKQNVIPLMDNLTPTARAIGAVNTIYMRAGRLVGDNTDAQGFLSDLNRFLGQRQSTINVPKSSIVLGAGGSARAVLYALLQNGWSVSVVARRPEQSSELARQFPNIKLQGYNIQTFQRSNALLIVNTTPVGMAPNVDASPWPAGASFPTEAAVYDLIYNPVDTLLVRQARAAGLRATTGLGMLVEQAALAFELWTGRVPPREVMQAAVQLSAQKSPATTAR
jgi:shikimate dehydrogenase